MAGASMKDIKLRIKSVESTMQITKAMQLVATSKLRRAKERMEGSKPYAVISREAMMAAAASCTDQTVPYVTEREVRRRCYVVIAGDRGLAGGYNNNVFKAVHADSEAMSCCVLPLGRKAVEHFHRRGLPMLSEEFVRVEGMGVSSCYRLAKLLIAGYDSGEYDEVVLAYTSFQSMLSQEVRLERLLPIDKPEKPETATVSTVYEPSAAEVLRKAMPDFLAGRLYSAVCDAYVSEVASRRTAMDSATKNAGEMISGLRLSYNRARQGAITQEITEIVAGAEQ
ncbi:MAG: ATP synthase F1 subunit gamma [bacterium]|nr:ATP synthase F1 subunit gamma [bacterium]